MVPLTEGGGTRLKILEAMSLGLPVVATSKAAEGLGLVANEMFLEANNNNEFAAAITKLAESEMLRNKLVNASQNFISKTHGSVALDLTLHGLVERAIP